MSLRLPDSWRHLAGMGAIACLVFAAAQLSLAPLGFQIAASPIWLPAGVALAVLLVQGQRYWLSIAIGMLLFNLSIGASILLSIGSAFGNTMQAIVGVKLLQRAKFQPSIERLPDVLRFIGLAAILTPCVNATISSAIALGVRLFSITDFEYNWWTIWLGDGMGILVLTPLLLRWKISQGQWSNWGEPDWSKSSEILSSQFRSLHIPTILQKFACFSGLIAVSSLVFFSVIDRETAQYPLEYLPFPFVIWAALSFGQSQALIASGLLSAIAISGTILERGSFVVKADSIRHEILLLQAFISVVVITALIVAAMATDRRRATAELRASAERDRLLREMAVRIRQSLDLNEILETAVQEVRQFLGADRVFLSLCSQAGYCSVAAESVVPGYKPVLGMVTQPDVFPQIQSAFASGVRPINDLSQVAQRPFMQQFHQKFDVHASIGIPIWENQHLSALLVVHQCSGPRQWQAHELDFLEQLTTQITIAIQQGELYNHVQSLNNTLEQQVAQRTVQLQASLDELEEMNQLRDVFFHAIAHDLRTTLIGTLMVLESLQAQSSNPVTMTRTMLERMVHSGETQLGKLNALLEAYTCKTDGITLIRDRICFPSLVQSVTQELSSYFAANQASISIDIPEGLPIFRADSVQMQRLFKQLLTNAIKHNPPGVQVHVQATVISDEKSSLLRCTVSDNGQGMSREQCDRLFNLRLHGSHQDKQLTGISVGLYLCHQVISAHGGEMGVESDLGKGSTFWFTLPIQRI